jgi:hypothetical protein
MFEHLHRNEGILNQTRHCSVQNEYLPNLKGTEFLSAKAIDHSSLKVTEHHQVLLVLLGYA